MKRSKNLFLLLIVLFLTGCATSMELDKGDKPLINAEKIASKSADKIDKTIEMGPIVRKATPEILNKEKRVEIHKEEQANYIDVEKDRDEAIFPITINFNEVDIKTAADIMSEIIGMNIVIGDDVEGSPVTARLVDVPWDKALNTILKMKNLAKSVDKDANIIRIHKPAKLIEQEAFDRKRKEDMRKFAQAQKLLEPLHTQIFRLYYTDPEEVKKEIEGVLGGSAGQGGSSEGGTATAGKTIQITVDIRIKSLIIKATKSDLDLVAKLIEKIDVRTKQVLIEAFIVEATDDFAKKLGSRLGLDSTFDNTRTTGVAGEVSDDLTPGDSTGGITNNLNVTGALGGVGVLLNLSRVQLKMELNALEQEGVSKVISNPRVFTLDNRKAEIIQGDEIPYLTVSDAGTQTEFKKAGLTLTVTPSIVGDGNIILDLVIKKESVDTTQDNPPIKTSSVTTKLLVRDRSIVVIGGIDTQTKTEKTDKVPLLGDLPILGRFFRKDEKEDNLKELLIFISPHIL